MSTGLQIMPITFIHGKKHTNKRRWVVFVLLQEYNNYQEINKSYKANNDYSSSNFLYDNTYSHKSTSGFFDIPSEHPLKEYMKTKI
uniref:Uncharacterized protein n=1 Tax=Strongyloides venezuelensis TaxID=75913 RepID=A0A0K0F218_STRVS